MEPTSVYKKFEEDSVINFPANAWKPTASANGIIQVLSALCETFAW